MDDNQNYQKNIDKAIEAFCAVSRENQAMFLDSQKLIIHEIMHERRDIERETIENHNQESRYQRWHTAIGTVVILGSLVAGLYVGVQQMNLSRLYKREGWLETRINLRDAQYNTLMSVMTTVRGIRVEGQLYCQNGKYAGPDPAGYQQRLLGADYKLAGAAFGSKRLFNAEIFKAIVSFLHLVRQNQGICDKKAATDQELHISQNEISSLILSSIDQLEKQKEEIILNIEGIENFKKDNHRLDNGSS